MNGAPQLATPADPMFTPRGQPLLPSIGVLNHHLKNKKKQKKFQALVNAAPQLATPADPLLLVNPSFWANLFSNQQQPHVDDVVRACGRGAPARSRKLLRSNSWCPTNFADRSMYTKNVHSADLHGARHVRVYQPVAGPRAHRPRRVRPGARILQF